MIKPHKWLWRQLNGPQITAVMKALDKQSVEKYDTLLDYLDGLSIETAKKKHLSMIGRLMQFPRPAVIKEEDFTRWFHFSYIENGGNPTFANYGFDAGTFYPDTLSGASSDLDDGVYRQLLLTLGNIEGYSRGLELIDELAYLLFVDYNGERVGYRIEFVEPYGDINVVLDTALDYKLIVFDLIMKNLFKGTPRVTFTVED